MRLAQIRAETYFRRQNLIRMKNRWWSLVSILFLISCNEHEPKPGEYSILPLPQEMQLTGISDLRPGDITSYFSQTGDKLPVVGAELAKMEAASSSDKAVLSFGIDTTLQIKPEGYTLDITENHIDLKGKDAAGLFYGFKTLEQLLTDASEQDANLPQGHIVDFPALEYRAVHLDVKHHLEKTDYYYELIDRLAGYKINAILLEVEDKLGYQRQPIVASDDALPISEWKKLSEYAHARHISISPLVQGLGHASFILKHPEYHDLRDHPSSDWAFNPLDPRTYEVQFDLYLDAIEATPYGKYLHVGGDEVHTTGRNSGKSALELQLIWLDKVAKFAEEHGRIPIFWDDMPLQQADVYDPMFQPELTRKEVDSIWALNEHKLTAFLDMFPKNCIYMRWNYSSPEAVGNIKAMEWFKEHGLKVMGATAGQTRWVLMPQKESNMENIRSFAADAIQSGNSGLLLTLWDDDSPHFELYIRGIVAFAEYTWSGDKRGKDAIKIAYRQREFGHSLASGDYAFIDDLEKPVAFWKNALLKGNKRNYLKSMDNALEEGVIDLPDRDHKGQWSQTYADRLVEAEQMVVLGDSVTSRIARAQMAANRNSYTLEVYDEVNKMSAFAPRMLLALRAYDKANTPQDEIEAVKNLTALQEEFKDLRKELEGVYARTRILDKPSDYILDQDHHKHLANQSLNFDWQFYAEILFFEKLSKQLESAIYMEVGDPLKK